MATFSAEIKNKNFIATELTTKSTLYQRLHNLFEFLLISYKLRELMFCIAKVQIKIYRYVGTYSLTNQAHSNPALRAFKICLIQICISDSLKISLQFMVTEFHISIF